MSILTSAKRIVQATVPDLFRFVRRSYKTAAFKSGNGGSEYRAREAIVRQHGEQVQTGPFAGMKFGADVFYAAHVAKLVGSYEAEIHGAIADAIKRQPRTIVNIGCAEGYYAVGFALKCPDATVYAFDLLDLARESCERLALRNGVNDRLRIAGLCDLQSLQKLAGPDTLVVCDCEGCERELLDPVAAPNLKSTSILVELHDFLSPGLTPEVLARFKETHSITIYDAVDRDAAAYPLLSSVEIGDRPWAVQEGRAPGMQFAYLVPR